MGKKSIKYYEEISNFRELVKRYESFDDDNVAFKYKKDKQIHEITYKQFVEDIKKVAEKVIDSDVKRVAVIGNNRYEWVITYLGVTTAGRIIVPLDKALTDKEIEKLLQRSGAEAVVYDEKYVCRLYQRTILLGFWYACKIFAHAGKKAAWRDQLGNDEDNRYYQKTIGDFGCYIIFVNSICTR